MSQPIEVYPNSTPKISSSHSNGSFWSVFIVLAVIVVISAIACILGRLCSRRYNNSKAVKPSNDFRPKEREVQTKQNQKLKLKSNPNPNPNQNPSFHNRDVDIEFGFDKRIPTAKVAANNGDARPSQNGEGRGEMRFDDPKEREVQTKQKPKLKSNSNPNQNPSFHNRDVHIEFGFDKRIPTAKVAANNGDLRPSQNGDGRGEMRFGDHVGEIRIEFI